MSLSYWPLPDWRRYLGQPRLSGLLRAAPEDFRVWELPLIEPQGEGSHLWLEVCKCDANTQWVADRLAAAAGVNPREVGFAGLKDRRAVTTQWFSIGLQTAVSDDWKSWDIPGVTILQARRHGRKLRRGALRGNRFRLRVQGLQGDTGSLEDRIAVIARTGVPNYFGPQRFGHGGRNVERAARWLERGGRIKRSERSMYLSAARSYLFNLLLAERVRRGDWNCLVEGEVAMLDGSRSTFSCGLPDATLQRRCAQFDIHPTGPLPGRRKRGGSPEGDAATLEAAVLSPHEPVVDGLKRAAVDADRRSLRVVPDGLTWSFEAPDLLLDFALPAGAYATAVLRELVLTEPATISDSR